MTCHRFVVFQLTFTEAHRARPLGCCCLLLRIKTSSNVKYNSAHIHKKKPKPLNQPQKAARSKYSSRSHTRIGTILARRQWCSALWDPLTSTVLRVSLIPQGWAGTAGYRYSRTGLPPRDPAQALPLRALRGGWEEECLKTIFFLVLRWGTLGPSAATSRRRQFCVRLNSILEGITQH